MLLQLQQDFVKKSIVSLSNLLCLGIIVFCSAQTQGNSQDLVGKKNAVVGISRNPDDISVQVRDANEKRETREPLKGMDSLFQPWYSTKAKLFKELGLNFGFSYTGLYQIATNSLSGENQTAGQMADVFGTWELLGRGSDRPGVLGFRGEYRGSLGTTFAPQSHFSQLGSAWPNAVGFGEFDFSLVEFWWEQRIIKDRFTIRVGKMFPFAIYDYNAFKSPKTGFINAAMGFNPTIAWSDYGLGATIMLRPVDEVYLTAGIHDANGSSARAGFDSFVNDQEYFVVGEIGWDPGYLKEGDANPLASDFHVTMWHTDARRVLGKPEGWGVTVAGQQSVGDLIAFLRYGYSEGGAAILEQMVSGGFTVPGFLGWKQDLLGVGLSWGSPSKASLDDQFVAELFHKVQWTQRLAVTPSLQLIANPAVNTDSNLIALFGIRGRFDF